MKSTTEGRYYMLVPIKQDPEASVAESLFINLTPRLFGPFASENIAINWAEDNGGDPNTWLVLRLEEYK